MFYRFRIAFGLALALSLITVFAVFAKGGFSFIAIKGVALKEEVRVVDQNLTTDFFAFANFYEDKAESPADPGTGYEITRYYVDGKRETAFDQLHYYPDTGFVYYDGIVNGSSEYDDHWYTANPDMRALFETALNTQLRLVELGNPEAAQALVPPADPAQSLDQRQTNIFSVQPASVILIVIAVSLALGIASALVKSRKLSIH